MFSKELHELVRVLWSGKWAVVTPYSFLSTLWRSYPRFHNHQQHVRLLISNIQDNEQQDVQEFLIALLDRLQLELGPLPAPDLTRFVRSRLRSSGSAPRSTIVDGVFRHVLSQKITCTKCNHSTDMLEPGYVLSAHVPPDAVSYRTRQPQRCHLDECLRHSLASTTVADYQCDRCQLKTVASKNMALAAPLPPVLCVCVQRCAWVHGAPRKIQTVVEFGASLDLAPYLRPTAFSMSAEAPAYALYAVIAHEGSRLTSGHYTAYCRITPYAHCAVYVVSHCLSDASHWAHLNDSRVTLVDMARVLKAEAYLLFYERS